MLRSFAALRSMGAALVIVAIAQPAFAQPKGPGALPKPPGPAPTTPAPSPAPAEPAADVPLGITKPAGEPSAADLTKARAIFDSGGRAYDAGDYETALQAFEQAYAIAGRDNIVFSIAQAHRQAFVITQDATHLGKAITAYKMFVASGKAGARKGEAVKALGELQAIQATRAPAAGQPASATPLVMKTMLVINSPTPGVTISVDGGEAAPPQVSDEVTPGPHQVKLTAPGYIDKDVSVQVGKGEYYPATFELEEKPAKVTVQTNDGAEISLDGRFVGKAPLAAPLDVPPGRRFVSVTYAGHESKGEAVSLEHGEEKKLGFALPVTGQREASYVIFGGAAAAAIATGILGGLAVVEENKAKSIISGPPIPPTQVQTSAQNYADDVAMRDRLKEAAVGTGVGAGALALLGVALFAFDRPAPIETPPETGPMKPKDEHPKPSAPKIEMRLDPWFSPESGGIAARGRF